MLRNKVHFTYQELLRLKEEIGEDNVIYLDNNDSVDPELNDVIPVVRVNIFNAPPSESELHNEGEQKTNEKSSESADKTKSIGNHPQSK
jgi:hypothetical protein